MPSKKGGSGGRPRTVRPNPTNPRGSGIGRSTAEPTPTPTENVGDGSPVAVPGPTPGPSGGPARPERPLEGTQPIAVPLRPPETAETAQDEPTPDEE